MSGERRVVVVQRRLVGYRVPLFATVRALLAGHGVALEVVHGRGRESEAARGDAGALPWAREVPTRYLPGRAEGRWCWLRLEGELPRRGGLVVLPAELSFLPLYRQIARRALGRGPRVALWGHGANFQAPGGERGPGRLVRRWVARRADWWLAYSRVSVDRVAADGFPRARITRLDNAVDTAALARWREGVTPAEIADVRRASGFGAGPVAVSIGTLHAHRRLPLLFAAAERLRALVPGFGLLIIGDGPQRESVRAFAGVRPWVRWKGALSGRDKVRNALVGSVMLNPGMVGLNILDAFALGLPLLTTDCGIHSPEIAYLEQGRNGLVTAEDAEAFAGAAASLLADEPRRAAMAARCRAAAGRYTVEGMAERFARGVLGALGGTA